MAGPVAAERMIRRQFLSGLSLERSVFWLTATLIGLAILYPASMSVYAAFTEKGEFSLGGFQRMIEHPSVGREILTTIIFATGATLGATLIGVPLAWINARTDVPGRRLLEVLCVIPLFISAFVGAMAWRLLLVPRAGMITRLLTDWGWPPELLPDVYSITSMIVIQSIFYSPFMYLYAVASLRQMDPSLEEVARIHGANNWQTFWRITIAVNAPALLSGMVLVFVFTVGTLEIPMALGIAGGNYVLATRIWTLMSDYPQDLPLAAVVGLIAILIAGTGIFIQRRIIGHRQFTTVTGKGYRAKRDQARERPLGRLWTRAVICLDRCHRTTSRACSGWPPEILGGVFKMELFTLDNFRSVLFEYDVTRRAIANSLIACSAAATIAVLMSTFLSQTRSRTGESLLGLLVLLPIAIPGAVFGMMVLFAFVRTPIYITLYIIIFAYVIGYFYLAYRTIHSVRMSVHDELEQSARLHGANWWQSTWRILLPLLKPGIFSAWLMTFVILVREFSSVMFLYRKRYRGHVSRVFPAYGKAFRQTGRIHDHPDRSSASCHGYHPTD